MGVKFSMSYMREQTLHVGIAKSCGLVKDATISQIKVTFERFFPDLKVVV